MEIKNIINLLNIFIIKFFKIFICTYKYLNFYVSINSKFTIFNLNFFMY